MIKTKRTEPRNDQGVTDIKKKFHATIGDFLLQKMEEKPCDYNVVSNHWYQNESNQGQFKKQEASKHHFGTTKRVKKMYQKLKENTTTKISSSTSQKVENISPGESKCINLSERASKFKRKEANSDKCLEKRKFITPNYWSVLENLSYLKMEENRSVEDTNIYWKNLQKKISEDKRRQKRKHDDNGTNVKICTILKSDPTFSNCGSVSYYGLDGTVDTSSDEAPDDGHLDALLEILSNASDVETEITPLSLKHLHDLIVQHKLPFKISEEETPGDGNCFLSAVLQNLIFLKEKKIWTGNIPEDVDELRASVISFMKSNRSYWTRPRFNDEINAYQDGPFSKNFQTADDQFDQLIFNQEKHDAWTDEEGFMVEATALYLDCQINIINTGIQGQINEEGTSGPLQIINKSEGRTILNMGLIKDLDTSNGHYQFIYPDQEGCTAQFEPPKSKFPLPRRKISSEFGEDQCFCETTSHRCRICKEKVCIPCSVHKTNENDDNIRYHKDCLEAEMAKDDIFRKNRHSESTLERYLSSPSARRMKQSNCHFCVKEVEKLQLELHLQKSKACTLKYYSKYKVKSIDAILFKTYNCLFCANGNGNRLKNHLRKSQSCLVKYLEKFNETDIEMLFKKIMNIKRSTRPSRTELARQLETQSKQQKLKKEKDMKTVEMSLNDYRNSVQYGNFKVCIKCLTNSTYSMADEVKVGSEVYEAENLSNNSKNHLLRFGKFWMCLNCKKMEDQSIKKSNIVMDAVNVEGRTSYVPNLQLRESTDEVYLEKTVFFPKSIDAIDFCPEVNNLKNENKLVKRINGVVPIDIDCICQMYENQLYKYKAAKVHCNRVRGRVLPQAEKKIQIIGDCDNEFRITGSDAWYRNQVQEMICRMEQYGVFCIQVMIQFPMNSLETIATALVQEGFVVNVDKLGSPTGELRTTYWVHKEHLVETPCQDECLKINLEDYIKNGEFDLDSLFDKHLTTHVNCIYIKFNMFIKHIIEAPNSDLFSKKYHFSLSFDLDGQANVVGVIWPYSVDDINLSLSNNSRISKENDTSCISFVEKTITCSTDPVMIKQMLNISNEDAAEISNLADRYQFHLCDTCNSCRNPELPSIKTLVKKNVSVKGNYLQSQNLLADMRKILHYMNTEDKMIMTAEQWIDSIWADGNNSFEMIDKYLNLSINRKLYTFFADETILSLVNELGPFSGAYHYCLLGSKNDDIEIVLKRTTIKDCFTKPYNPLFLKAVNGQVCVIPTKGSELLAHTLTQRKSYGLPETLRQKVSLLGFSHVEISLAEAVAMNDPNIKLVKTSNPSEFINAKKPEKRSLTFEKHSVKNNDAYAYADKESGELYDISYTNIIRYKMRIGLLKLSLAQFCKWYDYCGKKESKILYERHFEKKIEILLSDEKLLCFDEENEFLPEFIMLENGDVMKKRKNEKLLVYPKFEKESPEYMYAMVLLYTPFKDETEIISPNMTLKQKFNEKFKNNDNLSKWEEMERRLTPLLKKIN